MTWKGLKFGSVDDNEPKNGQEGHVPVNPPRRSEHVPRQLTHFISRPSESSVNDPPAANPNSTETSLTPNQNAHPPTKKRSRFNLKRFRHASDPQLSTSYKEAEQPPVPAIPPPQIITTAPTTSSVNQSNKRKSIFKFSSLQQPQQRPTSSAHNPSQNGDAPGQLNPTGATLGAGGSHVSFEEPGRLSTTSLQSSGNLAPSEGHSGANPATRLSDSSRSDGSSVDPTAGHSTSKNSPSPSSSSLFRFPRLKRNPKPLFPLPVKIPPSDSRQQISPSNGQNQGRLSSHPSPSRSSFGNKPPASASPSPQLFRQNSTASAHSARSSPSLKASRSTARRGRASTVASLADIQDVPHQSSPELAPSSRTSTNTGPRKSFSDLFNISNRLRQSTEPLRAGDRSPGTATSATPASIGSKTNSFSLQRELAACPAREEDDTPATYLTKLEAAVHRKAIATILSQSSEEFYATALRKYIRGFSFFGDPMDMAIRKLLMEAELPKETQQIDRVIQGFANRYHECNPGIFASTDQAYFIAFSLLILHTDVFNKNNKRKMQKPDYVKNTQGEGISDEILECFYDNICYTPFIHVEDELNLGTRILAPKSRNIILKVASADHLPRSSREPVDPYAVILDGKLGSLRPNLKVVMELEDVYSTSGPGPSPGLNDLHHAFYKPCILQIVSARSRPDAFLTQSSIANPAESHPGLVDIRVAKVGLLWRKDPKKKKTRSPWQEWGAVLTGSQLYFFRDVQWVKNLISQYESHQKPSRRRAVTFTPPVVDFKPDATMSMADAVALQDLSYKKHKHGFVLVRHGGFEEVFLSNSDEEMNSWLASINYAAAFRTAGVRMRGMIGANYEGQRSQKTTRTDSTTSETSERPTAADLASTANRNMDPHLVEEVFTARRELVCQRIGEANEKLSTAQKELDGQLRNARHLQVLTPVQPRARDQVILAAGKMNAKIKWTRMEIWRTKCHRDVLASDLSEEEKHLGIQPTAVDQIVASTSDGLSVSIPSPQLNMEGLNDAPAENKRPPSPPNPPSIRGRSRSPEPVIDSSIQEARRGSVKSLSASQKSVPARNGSVERSKENTSIPPGAARPASLPRQTSLTSRQSNMEGSLLVPISSHEEKPSPSAVDDDEERFLRENGILPSDVSAGGNAAENDKPADGQLDPNGERRSKVRRSLHRSLREVHIPVHHRSKKGRDQTGAAPGTDDAQAGTGSEGLSRTTPSFTVHGKKASVVTFGSEWQNMSPEQRLKQRKPMYSEDSKCSDMVSTDDGADSLVTDSIPDKKAASLRSTSTATGMSSRNQDAPQEHTTVAEKVVEDLQETSAEGNKNDVQKADSDSAVMVEATKDGSPSSLPDPTDTDSDNTPREGDDRSSSDDEESSVENGKTISHSISRGKMSHVSPEQTVEA